MVAQSEAVMATGVALVMGAGIAAMAAVNGGRLGGGGGLDRARGASTIPAELSGSGKGGYSTLGDLQIKGGGARQGTVKGTAAGKATGLHLGQGGQGRLLEVGAPIDPELTADAEEGGDVGRSAPWVPVPARACTGKAPRARQHRAVGRLTAQARPGCTRAAACVARKVRGARADLGARGGIRGLGAVEGTCVSAPDGRAAPRSRAGAPSP